MRTATQISNNLLRLCVVTSLLIVGYATLRLSLSSGHLSTTFYYICIASGTLSAYLFWLAATKLSPNSKINLSIVITTIGLILYGLETYLTVQQLPPQPESSKIVKDQDYHLIHGQN